MESGWVFRRIVIFDIRFVKRQPSNELRLGSGARNALFRPHLKQLFNRLIYDPSFYLQKGFWKDNLCVPTCILLALHSKMGPSLRTLTISKIKEELETINWRPFISVDSSGIPLDKLNSLEKSLNPIPPKLVKLFPLLSAFEGIALNVFTIRGNNENYRLFPISLSPNSRKLRTFFMCDLLLDSDEIRQPPHQPPTKNHCLLISNINTLLNRFSNKNSNIYRYQMCCRSCGFTTISFENINHHFETCNNRARTSLGRRKSLNVLLHTPFKMNKYTQKMEVNGLYFPRAHNFMLLKNSAIIFLDFECYNKRCDNFSEEGITLRATDGISSKTPKNATHSLPPMSYAYVNTSLYKEHPLPATLATPRFKRLDSNDAITGERNFYIALLLSLRHDLLLHHLHMKSIFEKDNPPIYPYQMTPEFAAYFASITECQLCGKRFGTKVKSNRYFKNQKARFMLLLTRLLKYFKN